MSGWHYTREPGVDGQILAGEGPAPGYGLDVLMERERPPLRAAMEIASALADVLCIAVEDQAVHGDIRPADVRVDETGRVSLEGWGVARRATRAPEGRPDLPSVDLYGLGVVLHGMLGDAPLGNLPRDADAHDDEVVNRVVGMDFRAVEGRRWVEDVRRFLCAVLAFYPEDRPQPLDAANVLASVASQCPGEGLEGWAWRAVQAGLKVVAAPATPAREELGGPVAVRGPFGAGGGVRPAARQAPAARGESTAFWSRERIAAMMAEEDEDSRDPERSAELVAQRPRARAEPPAPSRPAPPPRVPAPRPQDYDPSEATLPGGALPEAFARPRAPAAPTQPPVPPFTPPRAAPAPQPAAPPFAPPRGPVPPVVAPPRPAPPPHAAPPVSAPPSFRPPAMPPARGASDVTGPVGGGFPSNAPAASPFAPSPFASAGHAALDDTQGGVLPPGIARAGGNRNTVLAVVGGVVLLVLVGAGAFLAGRGGSATPAPVPAATPAAAVAVGAGEDATEPSSRAAAAARALASEEAAAPAVAAPEEPPPVQPPPVPPPVARPAAPAAPVRAAPRPAPSAPIAAPAPAASYRPAAQATARPRPSPAPAAPAPAPVTTTAEVGGSFAVRVSAPGREARIRCGDGQAAEFAGATSLSFTSMQTCVVQIGRGRGALTVSGGCSAVCTEENGRVTCAGC